MKSYGTVAHSPEWGFVVTTEPHVMVRLKRVFERVEKSSLGSCSIDDTEENAFELRWFLQRYPMQLDDAARLRLEERVAGYESRRRMLDEVLGGDFVPQTFPLALPPRRYQAVAAELALRAGGLLVGDDVGLGKTVIAIAALSDAAARPALVVVYPHLQRQWQAEFGKFAPMLTTHVLRSGRPYDVRRRNKGYFPDVLIATYHKLTGWAETLAGHVRGVVFDEVQELRRFDERKPSAKVVAARAIARRCAIRIGLSATPIYNYGIEMHHVLEVLRPGALGTREEFGREWCSGSWGQYARVHDPRAFGTYLRDEGLMIRRTRKDVGRELPACQAIAYQVDADLHALDEIRVDVAALARVVLAQTGYTPLQKLHASGELDWRLRLATGKAKARHVAAFVRLLVQSGESVVLYGWHHEVYEVWRRELADLAPAFFTGRESQAQKERAKEAFVRGRTPLIVLSLRAGAGLDGLQFAARTVVFGELDWSPGVHEQCIGRVYRDGQDEPVAAYYLLANVGSDPVVAEVLGVKTGQIEGMRDPDAPLVERQTDPEHIRRLAAAYLEGRAA